ncbi:MAG: HAMP domain-containing histidine kinase [Proteobacteria bacterium]|nr:HAMP domain-containing histidine kinase [Pseudomonadota bacterium]
MDPNIPTAAELARKQADTEFAALHRRMTARALKDAREKVTSETGLNRSFEHSLLTAFAQNHLSGGLAIMPYTIIIALSTLYWAHPFSASVWLTLTLLMLGVQIWLCNGFLKLDPKDVDLTEWTKRFITSEIGFVMAWAMLPTVVGIPGTDVLRMFLLVAVLIVGAATTVLAHTLPLAVYASVLPIVVVIVQIAVDRQPSERWMIAGLCFTALFMFVGLVNRLYATTLENLRARAEKEEATAEVEETNAKLVEAMRRAEEASAAKSRFLATMSHELRTPLNAILGFSEVMKDQLFGPLGSDQYKGYVEDIHSSGEHLLALINEVLDLSRIEAGKHELVEDAIDFVATVDACVRMLELRAQSRGLTVKTAFTQGMMRLWADERAVRQVTLNLLANAIKFTPQGSEISIKVGWTASGGQYLSVKDNGPGIPEGEIETVLSTFGRGSQAIKNADQGSGLGLPIVKSLVELHGGAFVLRSKLREGTEAIAMFPPSRVMSAIAPVVEKTPEVVIVPTPKHGTSPRGRAA